MMTKDERLKRLNDSIEENKNQLTELKKLFNSLQDNFDIKYLHITQDQSRLYLRGDHKLLLNMLEKLFRHTVISISDLDSVGTFMIFTGFTITNNERTNIADCFIFILNRTEMDRLLMLEVSRIDVIDFINYIHNELNKYEVQS